MKTILFLFVTALLTSCAVISTDTKMSGHVIDSGVVIYEVITDRYEVGERKGAEASGLHISKSTSHIPLALGVAFGMEWEIRGVPDVDEIIVRYELRHPPIITDSGKESSGIVEFIPHYIHDGKASSIDGFQFSEKYELIPGKYIISITYKNVHIESDFEVGT